MQGHYQYANGALLEEPNNYFYSNYQGKAFIEAWRQNRLTVRNTESVCPPSSVFKPVGQIDELKIFTNRLLVDLLDSNPAARDYWLPRLVKKFEVSKRIYNAYQQEPPHRPAAGADYHNLDDYLLFGQLLSEAFISNKQIQLVNVMLKLMDTLVSQASVMTKLQRGQLNWLCEQEQSMVAGIEAMLK